VKSFNDDICIFVLRFRRISAMCLTSQYCLTMQRQLHDNN